MAIGTPWFGLLLLALLALPLLYMGRGFGAWFLGGLAFLLNGAWGAGFTSLYVILLAVWLALGLLLGFRPLRRQWLSRGLLPVVAKILPQLGSTERIALEAGTVWWDGDLFSGDPPWQKLLHEKFPDLSPEEADFMAGPVEEFCRRIDDEAVVQTGDLPEWAWEFLNEHRFLGMIIPKEYGGLGFSALAHAQVITKIASRCLTAAVTIMVPNSLGPAELLFHYGTDAQKKYFLPRLARGEEVPCFALTGPEAGSDAAATTSVGVVCRGEYEGKEVLGMRLNWNKRYITLSPIATLVGLAFKLDDPDHLLGEKTHLGITCALIPAKLPGVQIGRRHDPLGIPFHNGPTQGKDVFVPLDAIIGGPDQAGKGWRMLMESLSAGRGISIPSMAAGGCQMASRVAGDYAALREQFGMAIGHFEGVAEVLAQIGGLTYLAQSGRRMTLGAVDLGHKPAVITAVIKAASSEFMRRTVNHAMDIRAGAGIIQGPRNILGQLYKCLPIGITVEGANILTRSMIIFGQGAIRCHPYVQQEIEAVARNDLEAFDRSFFGHINFVFKNLARAGCLGLSEGKLLGAPSHAGPKKYYRQLTWLSTAFALFSDMAMATLGGSLKRREMITGRLADILTYLYLGSAALKNFVDAQCAPSLRPALDWALQYCLYEAQRAFRGVLANFPNRPVAWLLRIWTFPWGFCHKFPSDQISRRLARAMQEDPRLRSALTSEIYLPEEQERGLGLLDQAWLEQQRAKEALKKIRKARRQGQLPKAPKEKLWQEALNKSIISSAEHEQLKKLEALRNEVIQVDDFSPEEFRDHKC